MSMKEAKKIETLRREFQNTTPSPSSTGACPDAEAIWDAATGELPVEERRGIVSHLCSCAACTHAWRLAWAMQAEMRDEGRKTETQSTYGVVVLNRWKRIAPQVAAAAMLVLALGVGVMWNQPEPEPTVPVHRGATVEHEIESLLPEGEALPREEFVLRWTSAGEGATYDVELMTEQLSPLYEVEGLTTTAYRVPREALEKVPTGGIVLWRVEALVENGQYRVAARTFATPVD